MTSPVPPWPAGKCPYVTPDQLINGAWPVGVAWNTIPDTSQDSPPTPQQTYAVLAGICRQATVRADQIVNTPLRSVETTETLSGPDFRVTVQWSSGNGRIIASHAPVTQVTSVQVSNSSTWPRQWTPLPAANFEPEHPIDGLYGASSPSAGAGGQGILFAPGYVNWPAGWPGGQISGRNRYRVAFSYLSGWPHACLTAQVNSGETEISVDDCTGWLLTGTNGETVGAAGVIYDAMGGGQESISVTGASATSGPGTLTLASDLAYSHDALIAVSALPETVIWATALLAGHAAMIRGATATTIQTTGGRQQVSAGGLEAQAKMELSTFRRTI